MTKKKLLERDSGYWQKRGLQLEESIHNAAAEHEKSLEKLYRQAQSRINRDVANWFRRIADNNEVSFAEARKMLKGAELDDFKWTLDEYITKASGADSAQWKKQLENASARAHISRLEELQISLRQTVEELYGKEIESISKLAEHAYTEGKYRSDYNIACSGTLSAGMSFAKVDKPQLEAVLSKPWSADGKNFSARIWEQRDKLVNSLHSNLSRAIMTGEHPDKAAKRLSEELNTPLSATKKLCRTEAAYFASEGAKASYEQTDVQELEILGTLDGRTCAVCGSFDGQVISLKDFKAGVTAPPFHPNCRCTTVPYFNDEISKDDTRAARDEGGSALEVPANMTYEDWKKVYVDKAPTSSSELEAKPKSGIIKITDVKEVKEALINQVGFDNVDSSFDGIDDELQVANTNQLIKLEDKFGCVHQSTGIICSMPGSSSTVAYVRSKAINPSCQNLSLCPKYYKSMSYLISGEKDMIIKGWSMPAALTDKELSICSVTHEYGHILQNVIIRKEFEKAGWTATNAAAFANTKRKTAKAMLKWYYDIRAKVQTNCKKEIIDIAKKANSNFSYNDNISKYGVTNGAEFFAEVFANSQLSKPNELGKAMNVWLKQKGLVLNK